MSHIWDAIIWVYAALAMVPVIPFLIVYVFVQYRGGDRRKAVHIAMDVTTLFLIGIVTSLLKERTGSSFGFYAILLVMLIFGGLIGNAQNRLRGKINPAKIVRAVWRLSFFGMGLLYIVLMSLHLIAPVSPNS